MEDKNIRRVSGGIVFVNRGWIADSVMDAATRPEGIVQIEAVLYAPEKYRFTPENVPEKNDWYWEDVSAMAQAAQLDAPAPAVAIIAERAPGVYPAGGVLRLDIPNNHRQYALFWYGMAAVLLIFYIVFSCSDAARTEKNA